METTEPTITNKEALLKAIVEHAGVDPADLEQPLAEAQDTSTQANDSVESLDASGAESAPADEPAKAEATAPERKETAASAPLEVLSPNFDHIAREKARADAEIRAEREQLAVERRSLQEQLAKIKTVDDYKRQLAMDPVATMKELGIENTNEVAKMLWSDSLGDKAPAEFRTNPDQWRVQQELRMVKQQLSDIVNQQKQREQAEVKAKEEQQKTASIREYLKELPEDTVLVRNMVKNDPDEAVARIRSIADHFVANGLAEGKTVADVIRYYEQALQSDLKRLGIEMPTKSASTQSPRPVVKNDLGTSTNTARVDLSDDEEEAQIVQELRKRRQQ